MPGDQQEMIKNILFPVDFSPSCTAMAAYVRRAAAIFGAKVTIVHICDLSSHNGFELYARPAGDITEEHRSLAKSKLELFLRSEFPIAQYPRIFLEGDAASLITETAKKNECDLIMMPTHAGRFRRMLLGSTTAKVLDDADCPVLTSQHTETIAPRSLEHREWLCAIGLHPDSERVLRYASHAASAAGARLSIIHAIETKEAQFGGEGPSEVEQVARQRVAELQRAVGSQASADIAVGGIKEVLLQVVRQSAADVLVIGRSPRAGALGRLRDLTYSLIRDSPSPVVSV